MARNHPLYTVMDCVAGHGQGQVSIVFSGGKTSSLHARAWLQPPPPRVWSDPLVWHVPRANPTIATLDLSCRADAPLSLALTAPGDPNRVVTTVLERGALRLIRYRSRIVGAAIGLEPGPCGRTRIRLAMAPTATHGAGQPVCPAGDWRIALSVPGGGTGPVLAGTAVTAAGIPRSGFRLGDATGAACWTGHDDPTGLSSAGCDLGCGCSCGAGVRKAGDATRPAARHDFHYVSGPATEAAGYAGALAI
ncbi:hypothetical protein [Chachezhania sediminis]|uniref:hypothetical protein n=1 Tax=Chachezhania sediminis TaxID=2599291 RepID=UPI00131CD798|nr:hypothetical protein [Chachezhania sediminis]